MEKKLYIETLGCAMNVRDSEHLIAQLSKKDNYTLTDDITKSDLIIINTCSVREKTRCQTFFRTGRLCKNKKTECQNRCMRLYGESPRY